MTFNEAVGSAVDPGVGVKEELHQFSKPDAQLDSGSELSLCSQKSFDKVSFGKTFQTQPRSHKSNSNSHHSNSHHSNSSHGYSFSNNHGHSRRSQDSGSHCGLSARSNVSDVMSEKAESVGSVGSKNRGKGRLVTGQSGSEGSEGKSYPGRSLDSLVGQSDNESFWPANQRNLKKL